MLFFSLSSERFVRKLLGKNDIEDALKRLDTLTIEEARMAVAENLNVTNRVDGKVDKVDNKVEKVDSKVEKVDDKVDKVDNKVDKVDNKVTVLIDGRQNVFLSYTFVKMYIPRCERCERSERAVCKHR
jgi:peptidoglycan hydrolase CwlO-like protein